MTRMAPIPRATVRHAAVELSATAYVVAARWRLGLRGTLTLVIHDADCNGVARATASILHAREAGARLVELHARIDASESSATETRWMLTATSDGTQIAARTALIRGVATDATPLLLTDLPEALGLQGGTYVLESLDATTDAC